MENLSLLLVEFAARLVRVSVQASVVIGLVLLAQGLFQKKLSPRWRYCLWSLVLIRLMLPVSPGSAFSIFNYTQGVKILASGKDTPETVHSKFLEAQTTPSITALPPNSDRQGGAASNAHANSPSHDPGARTALSAQIPSLEQKPADKAVRAPILFGSTTQLVARTPIAPDPKGAPDLQPAQPADQLGLGASAKPYQTEASGTSFRNGDGPAPTKHWSWPTALSVLWLMGVLFLLARIIWFPLRLNAQLAQHETATGPAVFAVLEQSKRLMGMRKVLPIVQSRAVASPALLGFIRPWLLLPDGMVERFTPEELRFVFLHELAHLKRRDIAVNWLMTILQILHWFNPLVWIAFARMRADRELACDELALSFAKADENKTYGQAIIKLLEGFSRPAVLPGLVGILEDKQQMKRRITMIAQFKKTSAWPVLAAVLMMTLGLISLTDAQIEKGAEKLTGMRAKEKFKNKPGALAASSQQTSKPPASGLTLRKLPDVPPEFRLRTARSISRDGRYLIGYAGVLDLSTGEIRKFEDFEKSTFTPDGKKIVGSRRFPPKNDPVKSIVVLDLETGKIREIYRNDDIADIGLFMDCSSDGKTVLASFHKKDKTTELVVISLGNGSVRVLKTFPPEIYVSDFWFSPDGHWVAYGFSNSGKANSLTERGSVIHLIAVDGSRESALIEHPAKNHLLGWAPFGDRILFASDRRGTWDVFLTQVTDGKPVGEPVLIKSAVSSGPPAYADVRTGVGFTDSGAFLFISENDSSDVYIAALDPHSGKVKETPRKATRMESPNQEPAWSHDSRFLAYTTTLGAAASFNGFIRIRDMETGNIRELSTDAGRVSSPRWAPDGQSIVAQAYHPPKVPVYRISVESGKLAVLWKDDQTFGRFGWGIWSPDGKSIYQPKGTNRYSGYTLLVQHDLMNTSGTKEFPIPQNWDATLSPNCEQFVFSVTKRNGNSLSRTINVASVHGGKPRELVSISGPDSILRVLEDNGLGWTPDNRYVLFVRGDPKARGLWRVPVVGGESEPLGLEMAGLRTPVISPDGGWIAFAAGGNKTELWVMENFLPKANVVAK